MIRKILVRCGLLLLMAMLAVLATTATPAPAASVWHPVGNPDFTSTKPASESLFVYNGTPYLAYEGADDKAAVMEYTGGSWQMVGGSSVDSTGTETVNHLSSGCPPGMNPIERVDSPANPNDRYAGDTDWWEGVSVFFSILLGVGD